MVEGITHKRCGKCRELKPFNEFHKHARGLYNIRGRCKVCYRQDSADYRRRRGPVRKIRNAEYHSDRYYNEHYGMSQAQVVEWMEKVGNHCQICGEFPEKLHIDHCHKSGKIRDLLCRRCNTTLGLVKEQVWILEELIKYLIKHKEKVIEEDGTSSRKD